MAESSVFWRDSATDGGPYSAQDFANFIKAICQQDYTNQGPLIDYLNELEVTKTDDAEDYATFHVNTGAALVDGTLYINDSSYDTASLYIPLTGEYYIRIILDKDYSAQTVRIGYLTGTSLPTLTQDSNNWQISLATLHSSDGIWDALQDDRLFCAYNAAFAFP